MNNRALTLSLVMAVMAVMFVQSYVSSVEDDARKKYGAQILVVTSKKDIRESETINQSHLELKLIPKKFLEPAAVYFEKNEEDKETQQSLKNLAGSGNVAVVPIRKGEQITYNKMTDPGIRTGLAPQIAPGKRGMSLSISDVTGVSKLVKPGDRVDLITIIDTGGGKEAKMSRILLQDIVVLATGRNVTNNVARVVEADPFTGKDKYKSLAEDFSFTTVTLEVDPYQAQALALVMNNGDNAIVLSLRNNDDTERVNYPGLTILDVLGPDAARIPRKPAGGQAQGGLPR
jgi:pilus assembly protein CpaB